MVKLFFFLLLTAPKAHVCMKSCTSYSSVPRDGLCTCLVCITRAEYESGAGSGSSGIGDITGRKLCLGPSHLQKNLASNSWKRVEMRAKKQTARIHTL